MSNDGSPVLAFALGSLAASRGTSDLARITASIFSRRRAGLAVDVNSVLAALQEMEARAVQQDDYIADLKREIEELRAYGRKADKDRNELIDWAAKADAELKRRRAES